MRAERITVDGKTIELQLTPARPLGASRPQRLGQAMRQWLWLYPAVETAHIVGIGLLFGSIAVLDLRLLGLSQAHPGARARARTCCPGASAASC